LLGVVVVIRTIIVNRPPTHPKCEVIDVQRIYDDDAHELVFQRPLLIICTILHRPSEH